MPSRKPPKRKPTRNTAGKTRVSRGLSKRGLSQRQRAERLGFPSYYRFRKSGVSGFLWALRPGDQVSLVEPVQSVQIVKGRTRNEDVFVLIRKLIIGADALGRTFDIRGVTRRQLRLMITEEERRGAQFMPQPSLDQRKLLAKEDTR